MRLPQANLKNKLSLVNALSKVLIIALSVSLVPGIVKNISVKEIDNQLVNKLDQMYDLVEQYGVGEFINRDGDRQAFGSYNVLKEEYISIEKVTDTSLFEIIDYDKRAIEGEIFDYRVISATFESDDDYYLIEIGKSLKSIMDFERLLHKSTFLFLMGLLLITVLMDLLTAQYLLRPFGKIIERLKSSDHPKNFDYTPVRTSTADFRYLEENIHGMMRKIESAFNEEREYISNISHELLTPISIIKTKLDNFVGSTQLTDEELAKIIESKVTLSRLTRLVRTLLLLSRLDNEEYLLSDQVNINELLTDVSADFQEHFEMKNLHFELQIPDKILEIKGNRELLHILFFNLVNNAVKYTPEGGRITLTQFNDHGMPLVEIQDNGIGIPEDQLPAIFTRFKKFQESGNNFGLGLALVKKIADYHHFTIEVFSKPGEGSRFIIRK
jgi:two-component system, OmpR family, sensor histidine kinase ArlS